MTARVAALTVGAATVLTAGAVTATPASAAPATFANTTAITIPGVGMATPYPSSLDVAGLPNGVKDVNVRLTGLTHAYVLDLDVMLMGPTGRSVILMSDAGNNGGVSGVNLTIDDQAAGPAPLGTLVSGSSYKPTNFGADAFPAPAPSSTPAAALSTFNDTDPNGTWNLYVVDDNSYDSGTLSGGWSLTVTTVDVPGAPLITSPAEGSTDNDGTVALVGTAPSAVGGAGSAGSKVQVFEDGIKNGDPVASDTGTWGADVDAGAEGPHIYTAMATDTFGNISDASAGVTVVVDTKAPIGTVIIDGSAVQTHGTAVTLELSAEDATSEVTHMQFSNDGAPWSPPEDYATTRAWTLSPGDGTKTVSVQFTDGAGHVSAAAMDTIVLDTFVPGPVVPGPVVPGPVAPGPVAPGPVVPGPVVPGPVVPSPVVPGPVVRDTVGPKVTRTSPAKTARRAKVGTNITATFNEAMSRATMTRGTVRVVKAGTTKSIKGRVTYNATKRTVTFNPSRRLAAGTKYTVIITAVRDMTGNRLDQMSKAGIQRMSWRFTTR